MNYILGAINTISAPYQYYRDLPPINPSTLTGAIDVIVIQRPTDNGDSELSCSPFHVRFGKWQILRPGEKKVSSYCPYPPGNSTLIGRGRNEQVNVSVNGHPIPFSMKVGEAGEAFFVFETEDDIPDDLITSPLLEATQTTGSAPADVPTDEFDAKRDEGQDGSEVRSPEEEAQEPDYLDLDAGSKDQPSPPSTQVPKSQQSPLPDPSSSLPSPPPSPTLSGITPSSLLAAMGTKLDPLRKMDQFMQSKQGEGHTPNVSYRQGESFKRSLLYPTKDQMYLE
jgi:phosphatidate phosphatase LPIN